MSLRQPRLYSKPRRRALLSLCRARALKAPYCQEAVLPFRVHQRMRRLNYAVSERALSVVNMRNYRKVSNFSVFRS